MRFRLRTLLIAAAVLPPILAPVGVWSWRAYAAWRVMPNRPLETGYLGAVVTDDLRPDGVRVAFVNPGTPAQAGGMIAGDVITSINRQPCRDLADLYAALGQATVGSKLRIDVLRDGQSKGVVVTLGRRPLKPA